MPTLRNTIERMVHAPDWGDGGSVRILIKLARHMASSWVNKAKKKDAPSQK